MKRKEFIKDVCKGSFGFVALGHLNADSISKENNEASRKDIRLRESIDLDWRFHLGDITGAEESDYKDGAWRLLDIPHDWSIEGDFDKNNPSGNAGAFLPGGIGWYRKEITWKESWKGQKVYIDFDGIYMNSDVWINGHLLGHRPNGYISFRYDLTPYLKKGKNVIAVRADNSKLPSARWYTGSGIYRHVWLCVTHPIHVAHWGTFIHTPEVSADKAVIRITTQVNNDTAHDETISVEQMIRNPNGQVVSHTQKEVYINANKNAEVLQELNVYYPALWSPVEPMMYEVETSVRKKDDVLGQYYTPLGIRKLEFSAEYGFRINGIQTLIKGTCNHEGGGGALGAAVPDDVLYDRLKQLKAMGSNAVRTSHNPRSPEFYNFCDHLGLMVMDEAFDGWDKPKAKYDYGLYFAKWWKTDLESLIKRDRNHPCVILWSIGNEVRGYTPARQKELVDVVHQLDPTRQVTQGSNSGPYLDVVGFNGPGEEKGVIKAFHQKHPQRPLIGTEMPHTLQTRGVYRTQTWYRLRDFPAPWEHGKSWDKFKEKVYPVPDLSPQEVFPGIPKKYSSSYDNCIVRIDVRDQFKHDRDYPFLMGSFRWSGFDYLGEAFSPWPVRTSNFGIIDLAGFPKDHYYLYQSLWSSIPMVHLLPHWTHPGKEGVKIPVVAYSNCEWVELFLNGISLGKQMNGDDLQQVWHVPYQAGSLVAIATDAKGMKLAETLQRTAGKPYGTMIKINKQAMNANRRDVVKVEIDVVDQNGIVVPHADNRLNFHISGPGRLIGVENGDIADMSSAKVSYRKAFMGKCMCWLQSMDKTGRVDFEVNSEGLKSSSCMVEIV